MEQEDEKVISQKETSSKIQDLNNVILVDLNNKKVSQEDANKLKHILIQYGFLDEQGCPVCGTLNLEAQILKRPLVKERLTYFKKIFLMSELTLCPAHLKKKMFESQIQINNLIQTVSPLPNQLTGVDDNNSGTIPILPSVCTMIPNTGSNFENAQTRFRLQNQHQSASFAANNFTNGSFNSKNYLPGLNNGLRPLNYGTRVDDTKSLEDIPTHNNFGATAISSSPQQQNYLSRLAANPIPFPPLSPLTAKTWSPIDINVVSPLVKNNFRFAGTNAEEAYLKYRESNRKKINNSAIADQLVPVRRMAYTRNFKLEAPENPPQSLTSSSNSAHASSTNGNGVLNATGNARRGKKILGQGIYKT